MLEVEEWEKDEFYVGATIRNRVHNFRWKLSVVYGPTQHEFSAGFLEELKKINDDNILPYIIWGDFNLIRSLNDRSSGQGEKNLIEAFNSYIEQADLRELKRGGFKFTWVHSHKVPICSNIDRFMMTTSWEQRWPLCTLSSITRIGSDHSLLILNDGEGGICRRRQFFFEKQWIKQEGFLNMVANKWAEGKLKYPTTAYSLDRWHGMLGVTETAFERLGR